MRSINVRKMEVREQALVRMMIRDFYQSAGPDDFMNDEKINRTFQRLQAYPETGDVLVIERQGRIVGYSIVINFWSNEYGGNILIIDELYLQAEFRGQGIGSAFLQYLIQSHYNDWVALELEVLPYNVQALRLYEKIGFKKSDRSYLLLFDEGGDQ